MREATGTITTFKMGLAFTFLFAAFLAIAITYNKAFKVKNETLSILEKYEGVYKDNNYKSLSIINNYLKNIGYSTKGKCNSDEYGVKSLDNAEFETANSSNDYYYCISYHCSNNGCRIGNNNQIYYNLKFFTKFNLPFLGDIATFTITGETKPIKLYDNSQLMK